MAAQPTPGGSDGTWGTELNAYLDVEHNSDGTHKIDGGSVQIVNTQTGAVSTGTTLIPVDDTIPQKTEGDEYMTLAITPTSATNVLKIEVEITAASSSTIRRLTVALFQDTTANALKAATIYVANANAAYTYRLTHYMTSGTTSSTTFKARAGLDLAGTLTLNGQSGSRIFGGVCASSITITEYEVA